MREIVKEFIKELKGQELRPPIYDSAILIHSSGWNTNQYYSLYYKDKTPYTIFLLAKKNEGILYVSQSKEIALVKEVFKEYWSNTSILDKKKEEFDKRGEALDKSYKKLSYEYFSSHKFDETITELDQFEDNIWKLNALVFFSLYFDKNACLELIEELGIKITDARLEKIWDIAVSPTSISFEKRRKLYLLSLIEKGLGWSEIAESCHYFMTTYAKVFSLEEIKNELYMEYGKISRKEAGELIKEEKNLLNKKQEDHKGWLKTLSEDEKKLVNFVQYVITIRDERKDFLMKATTIIYRFVEKLFDEAKIDKKYIFFWSICEMRNGVSFLEKNKNLLKKREGGYSLLVKSDNSRLDEYGTYEENKLAIAEYYKSQNKKDDGIIKGQIGSKGIVRGTVKVIRSFEQEKHKMKDGDILVTGMTRPEFVPLMKLASGIITDEGGITCHAAIVSRELGKPCIIGTKIATQVLKDGDEVELNANDGIVKILPKAK